MATARQKSGLRGVTDLRKKLRKLPQDIKREVQDAITEAGTVVYRDMLAGVPRGPYSTGNLASLIGIAKRSDGLSVRVGFVSKKAKRDGFYAKFIELGTKGYTVDTVIKSKRGKLAGIERLVYRRESGGTTHYGSRNVAAQPARPFIAPALDVNRASIADSIREAVRRALHGGFGHV